MLYGIHYRVGYLSQICFTYRRTRSDNSSLRGPKTKRYEEMIQTPKEKIENRHLFTNNEDFDIEPYDLFDYSIRSHQTRDSYFRRLKIFLIILR